MVEVDLRVRPALEPERGGALVRAEAEQRVGRDDIPAQRAPPRDAFELAKLFERVDAHVRVRADAHADAALTDLLDREEPVAEIGLGRRADADAGVGLSDEVELRFVRVGGMDDRRARTEAAALRKQLDRPDAVLLDALVDLARLLVGVDVQRQLVLRGVAADLLEPPGRAGADGVGGDSDLDPAPTQVLDLVQVLVRRGLSETVEPAARIRDVEEDECDVGSFGGLGGGERLLEAEVVELPDRGVARCAHLAIDLLVAGPDALGGLLVGELEHGVAPGPEVAALGAAAKRALESVAVRVDEAGDREPVRHGRSLNRFPPPPPRFDRSEEASDVSLPKDEQMSGNRSQAFYP